jgi:excisionase family DNA binding protein
MAVRRRPGLTYTAQDVARFCEVDLKTVHHWADRGRVPHHRTEGRHLRFRRNDLVRFLRAHGYPLPEAIASVRPKIISTITHEELGKKLSSRFTVRRLESAVLAVARIVSDEPDAIVFALDDPSFSGIAALARRAEKRPGHRMGRPRGVRAQRARCGRQGRRRRRRRSS